MSLAGKYAGEIQFAPFDITALLYEGNISRGNVFVGGGLKKPGTIYANEIVIGDLVELFDDAAITADATKGVPVVRKVTGTGAAYVARVKEIFYNEVVPAGAITSLASMIAGGYLRLARVEFMGMVGQTLIEAKIPANGGGADSIDIGTPTGLVIDISDQIWKFGTGTNTQIVPMTHLEGSTSVDVTGPVLVGIGLRTIEKVA